MTLTKAKESSAIDLPQLETNGYANQLSEVMRARLYESRTALSEADKNALSSIPGNIVKECTNKIKVYVYGKVYERNYSPEAGSKDMLKWLDDPSLISGDSRMEIAELLSPYILPEGVTVSDVPEYYLRLLRHFIQNNLSENNLKEYKIAAFATYPGFVYFFSQCIECAIKQLEADLEPRFKDAHRGARNNTRQRNTVTVMEYLDKTKILTYDALTVLASEEAHVSVDQFSALYSLLSQTSENRKIAEELWNQKILFSKPFQKLCIDHPEAMRFRDIVKDDGKVCVHFLNTLIGQDNLLMEDIYYVGKTIPFMLDWNIRDEEYKSKNIHLYNSLYQKHTKIIEEQIGKDDEFKKAWDRMKDYILYIRTRTFVEALKERPDDTAIPYITKEQREDYKSYIISSKRTLSPVVRAKIVGYSLHFRDNDAAFLALMMPYKMGKKSV